MAEKYSLDELMRMGAQPVAEPAQFGMTLAQVQAQGGAEVPQVSPGETFAQRGAQALPGGSLISNLLSTGVVMALRPKPGAVIPEAAQQELAAMGVQVEEPEGALDTYRDIRDTRRIRTAAGSEQNPISAKAGTGVGIAATVLAPFLPKFSAAKGAGTLERIRAAGATGAGYGALSGATDGNADLTRGEVGEAAVETTAGGVFGGVLGSVVGGGVEGARLAAPWLRNLALRQGKQAIQGGSDIAAATRKPLGDAPVAEALEQGAIRPLSTVESIYARLQELTAKNGADYNRIITELEAAGVRGPEAKALADQLMARGAALEPNTLINAVPQRFLERAEQVAGKAQPDGRLGLSQAEALKRSSQQMARYDRLTNGPAEEAEQEVASMLRQSVEDSIEQSAVAAGPNSPIRALADRFVPTKQRLGNLLEAERFAEKGAAKAQQRSTVGLKDMMQGAALGGGDPITTLALQSVSAASRNRLPSTIASEAWALSNALQSGTAQSNVARGLDGSAVYGVSSAQDWADQTPDDPDAAYLNALLSLLRRPPPPTP